MLLITSTREDATCRLNHCSNTPYTGVIDVMCPGKIFRCLVRAAIHSEQARAAASQANLSGELWRSYAVLQLSQWSLEDLCVSRSCAVLSVPSKLLDHWAERPGTGGLRLTSVDQWPRRLG